MPTTPEREKVVAAAAPLAFRLVAAGVVLVAVALSAAIANREMPVAKYLPQN